MHRPATSPSPNPILFQNASFRALLLVGFLCLFSLSAISGMETTRVLSRKRSFAGSNNTLMAPLQKKLRRLPHVFSRVLELPLKSDADVAIEVSSSSIRFGVEVGKEGFCDDGDGGVGAVRASVVQVWPGVVKVVVRGEGSGGDEEEVEKEGLELDRWRFRLPVTTRPERATAVCVDGELVVTVPKVELSLVDGGDAVEEAWTGIDRLVEVQ